MGVLVSPGLCRSWWCICPGSREEEGVLCIVVRLLPPPLQFPLQGERAVVAELLQKLAGSVGCFLCSKKMNYSYVSFL